MYVEDLNNEYNVSTETDLRELLQKKYTSKIGKANSFTLSHSDPKLSPYPALFIWVRNEISTLIFLNSEDNPGYRSVNNQDNSNSDEFIEFHYDSFERTEQVPKEFIVSFECAITAAIDFFNIEKLPKSVDWFAL